MLRWVIRENSPIVRAVAMCPSMAPPAGGESRPFWPAGKPEEPLDSPSEGGLSVVPRNDKGEPDDPDREVPTARRRARSGQTARKGCGHPGCAVRRHVPGRSGRLDDGGSAAVDAAFLAHVHR